MAGMRCGEVDWGREKPGTKRGGSPFHRERRERERERRRQRKVSDLYEKNTSPKPLTEGSRTDHYMFL